MITKKSIDFLESWSKWGVWKKYYFLRTSFSQRWLFTYYLFLYFINYLSLTQFHYLSLVSISLYHHITVLSLSPNLFSLSLSLSLIFGSVFWVWSDEEDGRGCCYGVFSICCVWGPKNLVEASESLNWTLKSYRR